MVKCLQMMGKRLDESISRAFFLAPKFCVKIVDGVNFVSK